MKAKNRHWSTKKLEVLLWEGFKKGRIAPFYAHFYPILVKYGKRYGDIEWAKDCSQDIFIDLIRRRENGDLPMINSIKSYLLSSLRNKMCDRSKLAQQETVASRLNTALQIKLLLVTEENQGYSHHGLWKAFASLPNHYQKVLRLHYLEGKPYKEVARFMQLNTGAVGMQIHRAKLALRKILLQSN